MAGVSANTNSYQQFLANIQLALTGNLVERCQQLSNLLQLSPLKELQCIFPSLVENVFGFRSGSDWGLLTLEKALQPKEFESLRLFLSPDGPILRLVNRFTDELSSKFEFPISCLPVPSQTMLQDGKVPALYINKLQVVTPGMFPSTLQLNAFEYFFFHFTFFIVNPLIKSTMSIVNQQDTLYAHLLEDYLSSFLPTDNRAVPLYHNTSSAQHSPILTSSLSSNFGSHNSPRSDFFSPLKQKPSLFKKGTVLMVTSPSSSVMSGYGTPHAENWRSETFILIIKEFYLNQNSDFPVNSSELILKTFVPSHYHVWMVRIMVKHLHFFFNSSLSSVQSPGHGQIMIDSLGRLKSVGMTQLIQKEIYNFLKSTFDHWPLDASFRVPLETYLSYIQPQRYTRPGCKYPFRQKFTTENLLFFTTMFQQILRRFLRMDLSCPKNAYMLFRLTKVLCTSEMRDAIIQAERETLSKSFNVGVSPYVQHSPEKYAYRKSLQMENISSGYLPLFSEPVFMLATQLLSTITLSREKTLTQGQFQGSSSRGLFAKFVGFFDTSDDAINSDDNSPADVHKVSSYLESSTEHLCNLFPGISAPTLSGGASASHVTPSSSCGGAPDLSGNSSRFHELSVAERVQRLHRSRPDVAYQGNPDLQPVRTFEVAFLVHRLNELSQSLTEKYSSEIDRFYFQDSFLGRVCRRVLAPPLTYHEVRKSKDMQSASFTPVHLPPRMRLRPLANKQLLAYLLLLLLGAHLYGVHPAAALLLLAAAVACFLLLSACFYPVPVRAKND